MYSGTRVIRTVKIARTLENLTELQKRFLSSQLKRALFLNPFSLLRFCVLLVFVTLQRSHLNRQEENERQRG